MPLATLPRGPHSIDERGAARAGRCTTTFVVYRNQQLAATTMERVLPVTQLLEPTASHGEETTPLEDGATCRLWRSFRGQREPRFVNDSERECAELLDFYDIAWEYEPVMFVLETDPDGRVSEAFRPDFYLPELNLFLEVTTMKQELVTRKNRKVRKLRQRYPDVNVRLFYRRDIEALGQKLRSRAAS
ncbi:MAG: hypothetical protein JWO69_1088 [Thermoleophilia bacterium]|jgi:hypothetical protein|nr:hypothetical protein [Thermoleophilia bacterium]